MNQYNHLVDLIFDNIKKIFYPEEWIDLDLSFSKTEFFSMIIIDRYGDMTMSQIAGYIQVSMSTATGIIDRLVKKGYLKRDRSESDRRIVVICLTDKGQNLMHEFKSRISDYIQRIDDVLSEEEKQLMYGIFIKIINLFGTQESEHSGLDNKQNQIKQIDIE